ncbi:murein L,D-transpeptidase [Shewanella maritima]|uniref:L,D-transpeptidase family protein n=1 Tax=Shewanella maritima TaxID=2520507 RepID=UPI0037369C54
MLRLNICCDIHACWAVSVLQTSSRLGTFFLGIIFCCALLCVPRAHASQLNIAAQKSLTEQLQLLSLATPTMKWRKYLDVMQTGSQAEQLEYMDEIQTQIAQYWLSQHVSLPYHQLDADGLPQSRVFALEPNSVDYLAITNNIRRLLWLQQHYEWPAIQPGGLLRLNDDHRSIPFIAERLYRLGDMAEPWPELHRQFNDQLYDAVLQFQQRHGLKSDGVIGPQTLHWLNTTPYQRAQYLAQSFVDKTIYLATIEPSYLLVNIPEYKMMLVDNNQLVMTSKVIVGRAYRQTPVFKGSISNIVINPTWTVPRKLMRRDVLPKIHQDGHYLAEQQFDVFDEQGAKVEYEPLQWQQLAAGRFPYRLVQRPGKHNALGRYKIHFKNDLNVYLHDTPDKQLFDEAKRDLSSGCVRIEKIDQLAQWFANNLVKDQRTWIKLQDDYQTTQWFSLKKHLPVHFVYWPAWVNEQFVAQYRDDIYHRFADTSPESMLSLNRP